MIHSLLLTHLAITFNRSLCQCPYTFIWLDKLTTNEEFIPFFIYIFIYKHIHTQYILAASPPCPESLRTQSTVCCIFIYLVFIFIFLLFFVPCQFFFNITFGCEKETEWNRERKIHNFLLPTFIYSISNTFSDFNTSIEPVAFVNEFFTSYALFSIRCVRFIFSLLLLLLILLLLFHSLIVCSVHLGSNYIQLHCEVHSVNGTHIGAVNVLK